MKKPSAVVVLLLVLASLSFPAPTRACSIRVSLWHYAAEAESIVLGRIERLEIHELGTTAEDSFFSTPRKRTMAVLRVIEAWKGNPAATLEVDLGENYESDGSARHEVGALLIVFLQRGEKEAIRQREFQSVHHEILEDLLDESERGGEMYPGFPTSREELETMRREAEVAFDTFEKWIGQRWSVVKLRSLDEYTEKDREALADVVELAVRLQADGVDSSERLEWHIAAAEHRATRTEGLLELYDFIDYPDVPMETFVSDEEIADTEEFASEPDEEPRATLTPEQLRRLAEGFAREPAVGYSDVTMLKLLRSYPDLEVDRAAASVVEFGLLLRPIPEWVTTLVVEALERYGDSFEDRIGRDDRDPRGRPIYTGEGENTLPTIWEVARRDLGIPSVIPAEAPALKGRRDGDTLY